MVGFAVGVGVGAGGCYIYLSKIKQPQRVAGAPAWPPYDSASHDALKLGMPQTDTYRIYEGYVAGYDYRTRNPKWVLEHLNKEKLSGEADRGDSMFHEDDGVDAQFRAKLSDYRNSGYDRGHMAPAANHKGSQKEMDETFSLVNISPQVGKGFNRDYWARFERFVRQLSERAQDVYVITGPLWMPTPDGDGKWNMKHAMIGEPPGLVSVPTHYYKVVVADNRGKKGDGKVGVGAFVMPNASIEPNAPLTAYTVPLEPLEMVAGTRFFPEYINKTRRSAIDEQSVSWRQYGVQQLKALDRTTLLHSTAVIPTTALLTEGSAASAGSAAAPAVSKDIVSKVETGQALMPPAKRPATNGAVHLCDMIACELPPVDFWQGKSNSNRSNSAKATSSGGPSRR